MAQGTAGGLTDRRGGEREMIVTATEGSNAEPREVRKKRAERHGVRLLDWERKRGVGCSRIQQAAGGMARIMASPRAWESLHSGIYTGAHRAGAVGLEIDLSCATRRPRPHILKRVRERAAAIRRPRRARGVVEILAEDDQDIWMVVDPCDPHHRCLLPPSSRSIDHSGEQEAFLRGYPCVPVQERTGWSC